MGGASIAPTTKWWIGMLITSVTSTIGVMVYINKVVDNLNQAIETRVEIHRQREQHILHPSKDAFDGVKSDIAAVKNLQDKMSEKQDQMQRSLENQRVLLEDIKASLKR